MFPIISNSTPLIKSAICIIRISFGDLRKKIIFNIFFLIFKKKLKIRYATYVSFYNSNNVILDKGIAIYFKSPNSYTGENMLEFHGHGNPLIIKTIIKYFLNILKKYNLKLAKPGDFTKRAFLNKKINIIDLENLFNIINLNNKNSLKFIYNNYKYDLILKLKKLLILIDNFINLYEFSLNFLNKKKIYFIYKLNYIIKKFYDFIKKFNYKKNKIINSVVMIGLANVGKSTIINKLIKKNEIIVTNIPGTTRDIIKKTIYFKNFPIILIDTAGFNKTNNIIEKLGIKLALKELKNSDIIFYVKDDKFYKNIYFYKIKKLIKHNKYIFYILNKIDLFNYIIFFEIFKKKKIFLNFNLSAKYNLGINLLKNELIRLILYINKLNSFFLNKEFFFFLKKSYFCILKSHYFLKKNKFDIFIEELKYSKIYLNNIFNFKNKNTFNNIFNKFCIGK